MVEYVEKLILEAAAEKKKDEMLLEFYQYLEKVLVVNINGGENSKKCHSRFGEFTENVFIDVEGFDLETGEKVNKSFNIGTTSGIIYRRFLRIASKKIIDNLKNHIDIIRNGTHEWSFYINRKKIFDKSKDIKEFYSLIEKAIKEETMKLNCGLVSISEPAIFGEMGNENSNTFDFIRVECVISGLLGKKDYKERLDYVRSHVEEYNKFVIDKIANSKSFQKFGIPVNHLKVAKCTLDYQRDQLLVYQLELKEV